MSDIEDKVREKLDSILYQLVGDSKFNDVGRIEIEKYKNRILSIPGLAVIKRNAELPNNPWRQGKGSSLWSIQAYAQGQQDMLKAGWVKEA